MGRSQCEAEQLVAGTVKKLSYAAATLGWVGRAVSFVPGGQIPGFAISAAGGAIGIWALAGNAQREALRAGCDLEKEMARQNPNNNGGTAGAGGVAFTGPMGGHGLVCNETYVERTGPAGTGPGGEIVVTGGHWIKICRPIVLDLDGDGIEYLSLDSPVLSDLHGDGRYAARAWLRADDGVLIYDENNDGIGQHDEWVLTSFDHEAETDLDALRLFDSNGDGILNASDTLFAKVKIGRDLNQSGQFEANEVNTLAAHGIASISLYNGVQHVSDPASPAEGPRGVFTYNTGHFVRANGSLGAFADVAFQELPYTANVYSDSAVAIMSYGSAKAWVQISAAAASIDLTTASYAGYTGFVDFFGNQGNDYVVGTAADNILAGAGGADTMYGGDGDDIVIADELDILYAIVNGGGGDDVLAISSSTAITFDAASASFETVSGGSGNDLLYASAGTLGAAGVTLLGNDGNDDLRGHDGNDYLLGGAGSDTFNGGHGEDILVVDASDSWTAINGGFHTQGWGDTVIVDGSTGFYFGNMSQQQVEHFFGGEGNDTAYASRSDNYYYLQPGSNRMGGGRGNDYLYGGAGNDYYFWERGGGYDTFVDRDYGEIKGDVVSLGEGITAADVTLSLSGTIIYVSIAGTAGGQITLSGFAAQYGPHDMLFVDNKFYDLNNFVSSYMGPVSVASLYPIPPSGTGGGGGGGTGWGGGGGGGAIPPLVFDLDGHGFELIAAKKSGIFFDWDGDGIEEETGWVGPDDGILFIDRNGDGNVTADEIAFGRMYGKNDGFVSDLEGLRAFDSNGNGSLDEGDAAFGQFGIWKDADSDAVVDAGETSSLQHIGLLALSLTGYQTGEDIRQGRNTLFATTDAVFADGTTLKAGDVFLSYSPGHGGGSGHGSPYEMPLSTDALVHIA